MDSGDVVNDVDVSVVTVAVIRKIGNCLLTCLVLNGLEVTPQRRVVVRIWTVLETKDNSNVN